MAFNFNWSPLIADTDRVRDMLTNSLNKSPKPPIIVDDIVVNELNLGSKPPELEILEVGDLAEDRFRGIFKMSYTGDAYLTLKTRVQANPLHTYLSTKPSFASPQPLAAGSGLTIPIQLTLSDIRLSGFVILVFSKQKGITLVFRNDPLESLKVSSTFDSIPFVRDYLQRTIENQLRVLFMEDLPAIIHRLSLRMFSPDYQTAEDHEPSRDERDTQAPLDPLASPAPQPGDQNDGMMPLFLDSPNETYASFSQKNLLGLAALSESQRTLSLFTPSIRDTVFRAWASSSDRNELRNGASTSVYRPATLSRIQSTLGNQNVIATSSGSQTSEAATQISRPTLKTLQSAPSIYTLGSGRARPHAGRKRKNRVVNLRKDKNENDISDVTSLSSEYTESASRSLSGSGGRSVTGTDPTSIVHGREGEITTPPRSPKKRVGFDSASKDADSVAGVSARRRPVTPQTRDAHHIRDDNDQTPRASVLLPEQGEMAHQRQRLPRMQTLPNPTKHELPRSASDLSLRTLVPPFAEGSTGGILEQAWMMKMATEIAKKVAEEKAKPSGWRPASDDGFGGRGEAPPAYVS